MKLTRDSMLWWLVICGGIATYFATMPPPSTWAWPDWCRVVATIAAIVAGKLATSPLPGANTDNRITEAELKELQKGQ